MQCKIWLDNPLIAINICKIALNTIGRHVELSIEVQAHFHTLIGMEVTRSLEKLKAGDGIYIDNSTHLYIYI